MILCLFIADLKLLVLLHKTVQLFPIGSLYVGGLIPYFMQEANL